MATPDTNNTNTLHSNKTCGNCGKENPVTNNFCSSCGFSFMEGRQPGDRLTQLVEEDYYSSIEEVQRANYTTITTDHLFKSYKKRTVVNDVNFYINRGEIVGLLGPNGAGKTTTFYMIVGLVSPDSGRIFLDSLDITKYAMYRRARLGIGYLAQEDSIFRKLTVEENILAILEILNIRKAERHHRLESLLDELEIRHIRKSKAFTLSGGERRRTEIARALASRPNFLLLDEPFAGVDPIAVQEIQRIILKLKQENDIGILITDHNARETLRITDRSYILAEGVIRFQGRPDELANNPDVRKIYLGDSFTL
jgi:lipopolysaccharide export system ATP-binding protein